MEYEERLKPPVPPKTFLRSNSNNGDPVRKPKLSLNLGLLETDLDDSFPPNIKRQLSRSPERKLSSDISAKVSKFEALAASASDKSAPTKSLWFYRDGLRTPTTTTTATTDSRTTVTDMAPVPDIMSRSMVSSNIVNDDINSDLIMSRSMTIISFSSPATDHCHDNTPPALPSKTLSRTNSVISNTDNNNATTTVVDTDDNVTGKPPPPLPPKHTQQEQSPPPRPVSKELKLEDILLLCAEYEKQIEEEKQEAMAALSHDQSDGHDQSVSSATMPLSPLTPGSPSSTLQHTRIKTNGSLPRDGKRLPSPSRSLPPTSPLVTPLETSVSTVHSGEKYF